MDLPSRLSHLFGGEECICFRRQLVLLRENMFDGSILRNTQSGRQTRIICSGSLGEGLSYPKSDDDIMIYNTGNRVIKTYIHREGVQRGDLLIVPSGFSPGYCLLLDINRSYGRHLIHDFEDRPLLSSSLWTQRLLREGDSIHGPCRSRIIGPQEYDLAASIRCSFWPDVANSWLTRNRSKGWPSPETVRSIYRSRCHVVPIGDPESPNAQHEWRISFSVAERTLMHSFNHAQFLTYNLLRLTLKRIIEKEIPSVLCSYFMKTTLFYTAENTSIGRWHVNNLEACFKTCLSVLYDYVDTIYCPNYFIPEYNMIKRKVNHTNSKQLLDLIRALHKMGIVRIIHLSGESRCMEERLSVALLEWKQDRVSINSVYLSSIIFRDIIAQISSNEVIESCVLSLYKFARRVEKCMPAIQRKFLNIFNAHCCQQMVHLLWSLPIGNKNNNAHHRTLTTLLRLGYNGDVTTGKLTAANYLYKIGKTESALCVIGHLLSEYPPYALDDAQTGVQMTSYMETICGKGYSLDYKIKVAYAPPYELCVEFLNAFPLPLRILIFQMKVVVLYPMTYAIFLQTLCHLRLQNNALFMRSLRFLSNHLDDTKLDIGYVRISVKMCVGIIKYTQGDNQSACRWLGSAYAMRNSFPPSCIGDIEELSDSVSLYIATLLNKHFKNQFSC